MTELPLDGLVSVEDVARFMSVSTKTVRRMMSRGELVTHRFGRSVRVDAASVTFLLAGSATSTAVETVAMNDKKNDAGPKEAPRLYRQRGRAKVWTAMIDGQEVPLGTNNERDARRKVAALAKEATSDPTRRSAWRVHSRDGGFAVTYYDAQGIRRLHRIPVTADARSVEDAERYAESWFVKNVQRSGQSVGIGKLARMGGATTFEQFAQSWTSGELAKRYPDHVRAKRTAKGDEQRLKLYILPVIGAEPMSAFEGRHGLELVEKVAEAMPPLSSTFSRASRRQVLQVVHRLLVLATYPAKILSANPLPKGFLPKVSSDKAKTYLYPDEDAKLVACADVPLVTRLCYGLLIREGFRVSELLGLTWACVDLDRGVVVLDENKTDDPRSWMLDQGVAEALRRWKKHFAWRPSPTAPVLRAREESFVERYNLARYLRKALEAAGVTRPQLFEMTDTRLALRAHDLRASFVTISLALGKTEAWITDRTGHRSSQMIYRYKRQARTHAELNLGAFKALHEAIPELAERVDDA
jgi:excisionase family DNA binding protein